jgi:hypothetical protein
MKGIYFLERNTTKICEVPEVTDAAYGSETWITRKRGERRIESAEMKVLPSVKGWKKNRTGNQIKK